MSHLITYKVMYLCVAKEETQAGGLHYFVLGPIFPVSLLPEFFNQSSAFPIFYSHTHCLHNQGRLILQVCCRCSKYPLYTMCSLLSYRVHWYHLLQYVLWLLTLLNKQGLLTTMILRDRQGRHYSHFNLHVSKWSGPCDLVNVIRESSRSKVRI